MRRFVSLTVLCITLLSLSLRLLDQPPVEAGERTSRSARKRTPKEAALIALGRRLFFDPIVSRSGERSCASCHDPDHGFSDPARISDDDLGHTRRHSQTLLDGHLNPSAHWDGEFETVEELVLARIGAIRGRRGGFGHGVSLEQAVAQEFRLADANDLIGDASDNADNAGDEILEENDDRGGGGDGDSSYGGGSEAASPAGPSSAQGDGASGNSPRGGSQGNVAPTANGCGKCGTGAGPTSDSQNPTGGQSPGAGTQDGSSAAPTTPATGGGQAPASGESYEPNAEGGDAAAPKDNKKNVADNPGKPAPAGKDAKAAKVAKKPTEKKLSIKEIKRRAAELRRALRELPLTQEVLEQGGRYDEAFAAAFGNSKVNTARIARAIAAYCRTLESTTSPFDRYAAGQVDAISAAAQRGLALFRGRAACASCHSLQGAHPTFTDYEFHNTGVVWNGLSAEQRNRLLSHDGGFLRARDDLEMETGADEGRARHSTRRRDLRSFKTPTLRDVAKRGPFMHDGRFATLTAVVAYYARGASPDPAKAPIVHAFEASKADIADLVAFLESLSGDTRPGLPTKAWRERAPKTRLRMVDADGKGLANLLVKLNAVGDLAHANANYAGLPGARRTDTHGWIEFTNRRTTHTRISLPGGIVPLQGALVPDSCRQATVMVPVRGHTEILVRFSAGAQPPTVLAVEHRGTFVLPGHDVPRTRLTRDTVLDLGRSQVVRYRGWFRTDVPSSVRVRLPGLADKDAAVTLDDTVPARLDLTRE